MTYETIRDSLHETVRVLPSGQVVRGIAVPHRASNLRGADGRRSVGAPPRKAASASYRHNPGLPADTSVRDVGARYGWRRTNIEGMHPEGECAACDLMRRDPEATP